MSHPLISTVKRNQPWLVKNRSFLLKLKRYIIEYYALDGYGDYVNFVTEIRFNSGK